MKIFINFILLDLPVLVVIAHKTKYVACAPKPGRTGSIVTKWGVYDTCGALQIVEKGFFSFSIFGLLENPSLSNVTTILNHPSTHGTTNYWAESLLVRYMNSMIFLGKNQKCTSHNILDQ